MGLPDAIAEQYSPPPAPPARGRGEILASPHIAALLIVTVAVATRIVAWWNPVPHVDDQFYLLAGEELLQGRWPYVDVWDRKPLGLFLLYAGIASIGGGSMVVLNIVATGFAAATAWIIRQLGLRFATPAGATFGALAYLFVIPLIGGQTGQSPVFYNLLMAGAAWLLIDAAGLDNVASIGRRALQAMLLCGLAMAIKQVSLVEGAYFGLAFLWLMHRGGMKAGRIAVAGLVMITIALIPTALALTAYALAGREQLDAFLFATVTSIFLKGGWGASSKGAGLLFFLLHVTLLLLIAVAGAVMRQREGAVVRAHLLIGWMVAAFVGYLAVPHFFDHYALPLIVPLAVSAATCFSGRLGWAFFLTLAAFCVAQPPIRDIATNRYARIEFERLAAEVDEARQGGCIYVGDGPTRLYSVTGCCTVTRYLLPDHLDLAIEAGAVGVDTSAELGRILAARPAVIVTQDRRAYRYSAPYRRFVDALAAHYRPVYVSPAEAPPSVRRIIVWQRKNLPDEAQPRNQ